MVLFSCYGFIDLCDNLSRMPAAIARLVQIALLAVASPVRPLALLLLLGLSYAIPRGLVIWGQIPSLAYELCMWFRAY